MIDRAYVQKRLRIFTPVLNWYRRSKLLCVNSIPNNSVSKKHETRIAVLNVVHMCEYHRNFISFLCPGKIDRLLFTPAITMYSFNVHNRYCSLIKYASQYRARCVTHAIETNCVHAKFCMTQSKFHEIFGPLNSHYYRHK